MFFGPVQMNDYVAAYHDSVLLIGEVMRKIWGELGDGSDMQAINHSYFRNITFYGKNVDGRYKSKIRKIHILYQQTHQYHHPPRRSHRTGQVTL